MECKKILKKLKIKGYLVRERALKPINHREVVEVIDMNNEVIVIKLEDVINRIK